MQFPVNTGIIKKNEKESITMNLKEAFRFQNKLQELIEDAQRHLGNDQNVLKVKTTYLRSKAMEGAADEVIEENLASQFAGRANDLMSFLLYLLEQKELLATAIHEVKKELPIDMDSETTLNAQRQRIAQTFGYLVNLRSSEKTIPGGGTGYRFNVEGNQVTYRCDVRKVTTIDFDRNVARKHLSALNKKSDAVSAEIDRCIVNFTVNYDVPFDVNDTFEEIFDAIYPVH